MSTLTIMPEPSFIPAYGMPEPSTVLDTPAVSITDASQLTSKVVFLRTRFGVIGNTRKVPGADVLETDADKALLRVSKQLLDSPELDAIKKADSKMRQWLYNTCLPFDIGMQMLPRGLVNNAVSKMTEYKAERAELVEAFITAYPALMEKASGELKSLYSGADYQGIESVRAKFVFDWHITTFGVPETLKEISADLYKAEQIKAEQQMKDATAEITALMRQTLFDMVAHLQEKLTPGDDGKPKRIYESAVTNITEFLDSFDARNVTNDAELAAQVKKARELLTGTNVATLRSSDSFREKLRAGMEGLTTTLSGMVEVTPGRKFRDE